MHCENYLIKTLICWISGSKRGGYLAKLKTRRRISGLSLIHMQIYVHLIVYCHLFWLIEFQFDIFLVDLKELMQRVHLKNRLNLTSIPCF